MSESEDTALTPAEIENIVKAIGSMKVKPKADTPQDFIQWMSALVKNPEVKTETTSADAVKVDSHTTPNVQYPRISIFSGDSKTDASYDVWRYEVECLLSESYKPETIHHAIRRSLKGEASRVVMHLGPGASVTSILKKLDSIYGIVVEREDILAEFYSARQRDDENCAKWSCRLEDIISKAQQKGLIGHHESEEMLRTMLFKGLRPSIKDICGHLYDKCHTFDELRAAVRKVELEHQPDTKDKKLATVKSATLTDLSAKRFESLEAQIQQMTTEIRGLKTQQYSYNPQMPPQNKQFKPHYKGKNQRRGFKGARGSYQMPQTEVDDSGAPDSRYQSREEPECYTCGQKGHIAIGCRVRMDHSKAHLNYRKPASGGEGLAGRQKAPSQN